SWTHPSYGRYNVTVKINWTNDENVANNILKQEYVVCPPDFVNDTVESGPGYFVNDKEWKITTGNGGKVWAAGADFYSSSGYARSSLYSQIFTVTGYSYFVFVHQYSFEEDYMMARVEITTDGQNWTTLFPKGGYPHPFNYYNGSTTGYVEANFSLIDYVGKTVQIRMNLYTYYETLYESPSSDTWRLDNFRVIPAPEKDLVIYYMQVPSVAPTGSNVNISIISRNMGTQTQSVTYYLYLKDQTNTTVHTVQTTAAVAAGEWFNYTFQLNYGTAGNYSVEVYIDVPGGDAVPSDNTMRKPLWLKTVLAKILLVDDDENNRYETYYETALRANAFLFDKHNISSNENPQLQQLEWYNIIVWFTGWSYINTITEKDQENLSLFKNGSSITTRRALLLTGQDIGYELTDNGLESNYFYSSVLMAQYINDMYTPVAGEDIYVSNVITSTILSIGTSPLVNIYGDPHDLYPDMISPLGTANGMASYGTSPTDIAGISYMETSWRHIYLGFSFETIQNDTLREQWMYDMITWLGAGITGLQANRDLALSNISSPPTGDTLHQVQFNTTIKNTGSGTITAGSYTVDVTIYNSTGAAVYTNSKTSSVVNFGTGQTKNESWTWQPTAGGLYTISASVTITGDEIPENNNRSTFITIIYMVEKDLAIKSVVITNTDTIYAGDQVSINVTVGNDGNVTQDGTVYLNITTTTDTTPLISATPLAVNALGPGENITLAFNISTLSLNAGTYRIRAYVALNGDERPSNNYLNTSLTMIARPNPLSGSLTPQADQLVNPGASVEFNLSFSTTSTALSDIPVELNISGYSTFICEVRLNGTEPITPTSTIYVPLGGSAFVIITLTAPSSAQANTVVNLSVKAAWSELNRSYTFNQTRKVTVNAIYDFSVDKTEIALSGYTSETVQFDFNITNLANGIADTFDITLNTPPGYMNPQIETAVVVASGDNRMITGSFQIPATASSSDQITVNIVSRNNTTNGKTIVIRLTPIIARLEIDQNIPPVTAVAGETFSVMFNITSYAPVTQQYNLTTTMLSSFNYAFSTGNTVTIPGRGGKVTVYLNGSVPLDHMTTSETFRISVNGGGFSNVNSNEVTMTILPPAIYNVSLNSSVNSKTIDNAAITSTDFQITVKNTGNRPDGISFQLTGLPQGWSATPVNTISDMPSGGEQTISITITWPSDAPNNAYTLNLVATSQSDNSKTASLTLTITLQRNLVTPTSEIIILNITPSSDKPKVNSPVQFNIEVKNNGTAAASGVVIRLLVNGVEVGNQTITTIAAGETKTASIGYTFTTKGSASVSVRVNDSTTDAKTLSLTVEDDAGTGGGGGIGTGLIVGIIVGILALLGIVGGVIYFVFVRKPKQPEATAVSEAEYPEEPLPEEGAPEEGQSETPQEGAPAEEGETPPAGEEVPPEEQPQEPQEQATTEEAPPAEEEPPKE
ncbi:MAG: CARDB domain-containing protein, partial [Thermoplasmata archaeon]